MKSMKLLSIGGYYPAGQTPELFLTQGLLSQLRLQCALSPRTPAGKAIPCPSTAAADQQGIVIHDQVTAYRTLLLYSQ